MFKRKRKNDDNHLLWIAQTWIERVLIITGAVTFIAFALGCLALIVWPSLRRPSLQTLPAVVYKPSPMPNATVIPNQMLTVAPSITPWHPFTTSAPVNERLIFITRDDSAVSNAFTPDDGTFKRTAFMGNAFIFSPDRHWLAQTSNGWIRFLHLNSADNAANVHGFTIAVQGNGLMPAWNIDSSSLAFVSREQSGDVIYLVKVSSDQPQLIRLMTVPRLLAPPLFHPATGRILITEGVGSKTALYTIDPNCTSQSDCAASRQDIGIIDYYVNWATFYPDATSILIESSGQFYLVATADAHVTPFITDGVPKHHPAFNKDGSKLAYVGYDGELYIVRVSDKSVLSVSFNDVVSVEWAD